MALIKRNIWILFYMILIIGFGILFFVILNIYNNTYEKYEKKQESIVNVSSTSIYSTFLQYEMLLDILGEQLVYNNNYKSKNKSRQILDNLLKLNSPIIAFGLAKPDGQLYVTSSNLKNIKKLPNLLKKPETTKSFRYALNEDKMVIGRTYFHNTLNTLIIPIRKAIKGKDQKTIAVMTAGINVKKAINTNKSIILFRDIDYFNQLTKYRDKKHKEVYNKPLSLTYVNHIIKKVEQKYKKDIFHIKNDENIFSIEYEKLDSKHKVLSAIKYIKRYKLWILHQNRIDKINDEILNRSLPYLVIYVITSLILFFMFRYINKIEYKKRKALYHQASHDYLTNLNNRLYLANNLDNVTVKNSKPFTVFFIDMDNFKNINDNYGHNYGDMILKEVSFRLQSFKKQNDILVRYSGDEFILVSYVIKKEKVKKIANDIINRLLEPYSIRQYQFILGASIGIAQFPLDGKDFDEVKRYADIAMYEAKKKRNTYYLFEDSIKHKHLRNSLIEQELKTAIQNDEIYMVYQPQIDIKGNLYGVEALVRWENEKLGFIPPDEFIKIAETSGIMTRLGKHIIEKSFIEINQLQKNLNKEFQLSLNISVKQFMEPNFYDKLFEQIERLNFNRLKITLEVTESIFIDDIEFILSLLNKLRNKDIKISLDDFGTGYSSLSLLKKLPIDELKIDKSFIDDILYDEDSLNMVESIISIGKTFKMSVLAEGIESKEQKEKLTNISCDLFQGYYFSKPLKVNDLKNYILNNHT